jgi:transposase
MVQRQLRRRQLLPFMAQLPNCLVGMEACGGAHYWAREIAKLGHEVKPMSPRFVRPYVKSSENDARDAAAILRSCAPTLDAIRFRSVVHCSCGCRGLFLC